MAKTRFKPTAHPIQGLRYYPVHNADDFAVRPTTWKKMLTREPTMRYDIDLEIRRAARKKLYQSFSEYKPAVGDIIFFDGNNEGSRVIAQGNEARSGIPGTGRFTHVSIVVGVDKHGNVLIAEAGGGGIRYMRQATIRDCQSGHLFRPRHRELAYHYAQIALDATKFDYEQHLKNLEKAYGKKAAEQFKAKFPKNNSWGTKDYQACLSAPYSVAGMLGSKFSALKNRIVQRSLISKARAAALHNPGFRKANFKKPNSTYNPWCSRFAMMAIAGGYVEYRNQQGPKLPLDQLYPELANTWIDEAFAKPSGRKDNTKLRFLAPKTLYEVLMKAKDGDQPMFKRLGSWMNFDDRNVETNERALNYRYNGGKPDAFGARPFLNNQFDLNYDGKKKTKEMCEDGATCDPKPLYVDRSPEFQQLKAYTLLKLKLFKEYLEQLAISDTNNTLKIANQRLMISIEKATDYEDLLLSVAEASERYQEELQTLPLHKLTGVSSNPYESLVIDIVETKRAYTIKQQLKHAASVYGTSNDNQFNQAKTIVPAQQEFYVNKLLQMLNDKTFWRTQTHVIFGATFPDGVKAMRECLENLPKEITKNGLGAICFDSVKEVLPELQAIARARLAAHNKRTPFMQAFYEAIVALDFAKPATCEKLMAVMQTYSKTTGKHVQHAHNTQNSLLRSVMTPTLKAQYQAMVRNDQQFDAKTTVSETRPTLSAPLEESLPLRLKTAR